MKKLSVVLLAVLALGSIAGAVVACGEEETTTTIAAAGTTATAADGETTTSVGVTTTVAGDTDSTTVDIGDAWTTEEAADHLGETGSILGEVVGIQDLGETAQSYLIALDSAEDGAGANGLMQWSNAVNFIGSFGPDLIGKTVIITGEIYLDEGAGNKPEVELITADQLQIVD